MVLLLEVVIGAMAGWGIGEWRPNSEFGMAGHIAIGIIGALLGGSCFEIANPLIMGSLMTALVSAIGLVLAGRMARFDIP